MYEGLAFLVEGSVAFASNGLEFRALENRCQRLQELGMDKFRTSLESVKRGLLTIVIVQHTLKPYSKYLGPYVGASKFASLSSGSD